MGTLINVTYRLPVSVGKSVRRAADGLLGTIDHAIRGRPFTWVGWPGKIITLDKARRDLAEDLQTKHDQIPVFLSQTELDGFYYGYANSCLWPALHYMPQYLHYENRWWKNYKAVNEKFAEVIAEKAADDDIVWVHDYQLMLLPGMLREKRPGLRIGFFLHTPFPSYELFRTLPHREDLARGLLGADQIGFHTYGYMRHFRSAVLRLLGYDTEIDHVLHQCRRTYVGVYPIGIDASRFKHELTTKRHSSRKSVLRQAYQGKTLVLSVERIDYSKGMERKLEAIDKFLETWPRKDDIIFLFVGIPSRVRVNEYRLLRERVESRIGHINGRHGTVENVPVHPVFHSLPFAELCALYAVADAALVTPLIDGMNLVAKEYVACKDEENGVLLLSEFAGAAEELSAAVRVNPFNVEGMAQKLAEALNLNDAEKRSRIDKMRKRVMHYDARQWAQRFIADLCARPAAIAAESRYEKQKTEILKNFEKAERIGCFLDYDGTLREFEKEPTDATPMPEICDLLCELAENPRIDPYLISGRMRDEMQEWFAELDVTLIAEHGFAVRKRGEAGWEALHDDVDLSWKSLVAGVFHYYEGITPGSHTEEKQASVVWHYRAADPEFGQWKARQLVVEIEDILIGLPVELHHGQDIVEVVSVHVNKGAAVESMIRHRQYDLVVCAGDDITDESMLRQATAQRFGIKVGAGETEARYQIGSPRELRSLLEEVLTVL